MRTLNIAVVGIGGRGAYFVEKLRCRPDVRVAALCDGIPAKANWAAQAYGLDGVPVFADIGDLLSSVDCDAVMVATPDAHHAEVAVPVLEAGRHLFLEKPLDTTLDRCRAVADADDRAGGKTFVGFNLRYAPLYAAAKRLIDEGRLGRLLTLQADEFYEGGRTYFRRWNRLRSVGGGLWITKACHDFDLLTWLSGATPRKVYAVAHRTHYTNRPEAGAQCRSCSLEATCPDRAPREAHPLAALTEEHTGEPHDRCLFNADGDTFDHGIATVEFENDLVATYTCNVVTGLTDRRLRVSGEQGTLDGHLGGKTLQLTTRHPSRHRRIRLDEGDGGHGGADGHLLDDFLGFVRGESEPRCRPREAITPVLMGLAATRSCDEGRAMDMKETP